MSSLSGKTYIFDSNAFIGPWNFYYAKDLVPTFWDKLLPHILDTTVRTMDCVLEEIKVGDLELWKWLKSIKGLYVYDSSDFSVVQGYRKVLNYIASSELYTSKALNNWSDPKVADPYLIGACISTDLKLVSFEKRNKSITATQPSNKPKIPDIADEFSVDCVSLYAAMRDLSFLI